jgi:predicted DNA-binding WGR domain protein
MWKGYDLHCVSDRHDKFYRIIHCGGTVVIRFGRRGSQGQRVVKTMNAQEAYTFTERQHGDKLRGMRGERYTEIRRDYSNTVPAGLTTADPWVGATGEVADSIEEMYLSRWRESARISPDDKLGHWAVFRGLLRDAKVDMVAGFMLDELKATPYAIDASRDLVMGRVSGYERARTTWSWVYSIGPADTTDGNEIASAALGLYRPDNPRLDKLFPTARRLVGAS